MDEKEHTLVRKLLAERAYQLRNLIRENESLAVPCPPGSWRWADMSGAYSRKTEQELAVDRARAVQRAADYRDELALAESAWRKVNYELEQAS